MRTYVVKQGDYLLRLAHELGFDADAVWSDPKNAELVAQRPNRDILLPGDILHLPDPKPAPQSVVAGSTNTYAGKVPTVKIELELLDDGQPIADEAYEVEGLDDPGPGTTDGAGRIVFEIPVTTSTFRLVLPARRLEHEIVVGHMDPLADVAGVRARLWNLGLLRRDERSEDADALEQALRAFQESEGLPVTGAIDDATRTALERRHGS